MNVIGVTGTNGKTSTTYLMKSILDRIGKKVGIIGTIENRIGDEVLKASGQRRIEGAAGALSPDEE